MSELTREQIEDIREDGPALITAGAWSALCDMALRTLDAEARQEAAHENWSHEAEHLGERAEKAEARIRKLERALRPFADAFQHKLQNPRLAKLRRNWNERMPDEWPIAIEVTMSDGRTAREALAPPDSEPAEGTESCNPTRPDGGRWRERKEDLPRPDSPFEPAEGGERRDAGDALRAKLSDPETMQRVTERAAERQDAMLERRDALEVVDEVERYGHASHGDLQKFRANCNTLRYLLSRTSDEGTGYNEVAGEVYQAVGVLLSDAGRFDDPDGIALLDACSYLAGNRDNPPDSLLPFESKGTGCVVPEAIKRLPDFFDEVARRIKPNIPEDDPFGDGVGEGYRECASVLRHKLDRAIAKQGGQRVPEESVIDDIVDGYELWGEDEHGNEGRYTPSEHDRIMLKDFAMFLLSELDARAAADLAERLEEPR